MQVHIRLARAIAGAIFTGICEVREQMGDEKNGAKNYVSRVLRAKGAGGAFFLYLVLTERCFNR
jgi:hypothetical protein